MAGSEDKAAAARIEAMANLLAKAQRLGVAVDCTYDVVQNSGQKIEFGERRELTLRRPDRARVDVTRRDGSRRGIRFDGTQLTAFDLDEKVYATVKRPGTVDAALDHYTQNLKMRLPLRELFAADLPQQLKDVLRSARLVNKETVGVDWGGYDAGGPAADGSFGMQYPNQGERQEQRQERREERQDRRDTAWEDGGQDAIERREDWRELAEDRYDDGDYGGYYDDGGAAVYWTLPCTPNTIALGGAIYYVCGSTWYIRAYSEGDLVYTIVPNPTGH